MVSPIGKVSGFLFESVTSATEVPRDSRGYTGFLIFKISREHRTGNYGDSWYSNTGNIGTPRHGMYVEPLDRDNGNPGQGIMETLDRYNGNPGQGILETLDKE